VDAFREKHQRIVVPTHAGRRGHPVLFARAVFDELLTAPNDEGARAVVRKDPTRVLAVPVDDPAVLEDFNTPEDYKQLLRKEDQVRGD
jgi:molybdenum cofactor cytidylyltransferase